jgi:hypothetical protein
MNRAQLDFVRGKVAAGAQPWKGALDRASRSRYAALTWTAKPRATVECGSSSNPDNGCSDEREDAVAAYTHALLFSLTGEKSRADKAIQIMKAWAGTIKEHTNSNAPLQTGWSAVSFAKAGELIRHTYDGWAPADVDEFANSMRTVYLPTLAKGSPNTNGNWELIMTEAAIGLAVFLDDRSAFQTALELWRGRVPAYAYLESDGPYPVPPPHTNKDTPQELIEYWQGQSTFRNGLAQETCRDFGHTQWGIAAALNAAETAYQQGVDLYGEHLLRLTTTLEFHADYALGTAAPSWLCGGWLSLNTTPTFEMGYNHYHNRKGVPLPRTLGYLEQKVRTSGSPISYFLAWETLTHAEVGAVGLP